MVYHGLAERFGEPPVRRLVERLPGEKEVPERACVVFTEKRRVLLLQHPRRGGRREHDRYLVVGHDLPPDAASGRIGRPSYSIVVMPWMSGP
jgi:hypothetical protein